jgi:hypothetical protein
MLRFYHENQPLVKHSLLADDHVGRATIATCRCGDEPAASLTIFYDTMPRTTFYHSHQSQVLVMSTFETIGSVKALRVEGALWF